MSTGSSGAVASAMVAAASGALLLHTTRVAHIAHKGTHEQRFYLFLSASLALLIIMHILQCVFAADPQTDIRLAQLVVHLIASATLSATAVQGWIMRCHESAQGAPQRDYAPKSAVKGAAEEGPSSFFSISRRARNDSPGPPSGGGSGGEEEQMVPMAMLREKFRLESKLRESRRQVIQFTTSLNILHYCAPLSPRRPFAITSMPRGESLLASLPPFDFETVATTVTRLNDEVILKLMRAPPSAPSSPSTTGPARQLSLGQILIPMPVKWQQLRDVERLLLHPVAIELFKSFLVAQPAHAAFPAVEPVAAVMLILDAKRLPIAERSALPKLLANLLSCYLGRCDEPTPPPCILPLSPCLLARFTAALIKWKAESANPQATLGAAELLQAVQTLFGEAVIECVHWLTLLYLPAFQECSSNKLAQFCVGSADSPQAPGPAETPKVRRVHSDPKSSAAAHAAVTLASQRNLCLPSSTPPGRRVGVALSVNLPPSVASRSRVMVHSPPSRGADTARTSHNTHSQQKQLTHHSSRSFEMGSFDATALKSSTPSPQQHSAPAPQIEPPTLVVRPKLAHWKSQEQAPSFSSSSAPPASVSPTHSAPVSGFASTAPLPHDREWSPRDGTPSPHSGSSSSSPAGTAVANGSAAFRLPNTASAGSQMSLRKAVLIAAQEVATPTMHSSAASVAAAAAAMQPPPVSLHLESTPEETSSSSRPSSGSVSASDSSFHHDHNHHQQSAAAESVMTQP